MNRRNQPLKWSNHWASKEFERTINVNNIKYISVHSHTIHNCICAYIKTNTGSVLESLLGLSSPNRHRQFREQHFTYGRHSGVLFFMQKDNTHICCWEYMSAIEWECVWIILDRREVSFLTWCMIFRSSTPVFKLLTIGSKWNCCSKF